MRDLTGGSGQSPGGHEDRRAHAQAGQEGRGHLLRGETRGQIWGRGLGRCADHWKLRETQEVVRTGRWRPGPGEAPHGSHPISKARSTAQPSLSCGR